MKPKENIILQYQRDDATRQFEIETADTINSILLKVLNPYRYKKSHALQIMPSKHRVSHSSMTLD